eukprot:gene10087-3328_t
MECGCAKGYGGRQCDILEDCFQAYIEQKKNPCSAHGKCVPQTGEKHCTCDVGYSGSMCEVKIITTATTPPTTTTEVTTTDPATEPTATEPASITSAPVDTTTEVTTTKCKCSEYAVPNLQHDSNAGGQKGDE